MHSKIIWLVCGLMWGNSIICHAATFSPGSGKLPQSSFAGVAGGVGNSVAAPAAPADDAVAVQLSDFLKENVQAVRQSQAAAARLAQSKAAQDKALQGLQQSVSDLHLQFRSNDTPLWVSGNFSDIPAVAEANQVTGRVNAFFAAYGSLFQINDFANEFTLASSSVDNLGFNNLLYQQKYLGLDVFLCELTVHVRPDGHISSISSATIPTPQGVDVIPSVTPEEAIQRASMLNPLLARGVSSKPELVIFGAFEHAPALAWKFDLQVGGTLRWRNLVNATTGDLIEQYSITQTAAVKGSGADGNGITRALDLWQDGAAFYLVDASKPMFDPSSTPPLQGRGVINIYDGQNKDVVDPQFSAGLIQSTSATSGWLPDAVGAAWGLSQTYDYFRTKHQRNSLDGQGGTIRAIVRYKLNEANAFFIGETTTMVFGDLQPRLIDISAHELAHGVTNASGNGGVLEYRFQPGALNESFSDIFAELVENFATGSNDWKMFLAFADGNRQIRDFAQPGVITSGGRPFPSKMSEFWELPADDDAGGVHINSSINNHCFYQLSTAMDGAIGLEDAGRIYYRTLTTYMKRQSQFVDVRIGAIQSAIDIFGADSVQVQKTRQAYDLVEIFDAPPAPKPAPVPILEGDDSVLFFRYDPFFDAFLLGRRELGQGDSASGILADTLEFPLLRRTSVTGDGSIALFLTESNDIGFINTLTGAVSFAGLLGQIHSIAMDPSGLLYAAVLRDLDSGEPINSILLIDLQSEKETKVRLIAPTQDGPPMDIIAYADAIDFLPDGSGLVYDALARIPIEGLGMVEAWTLYTLDIQTQSITMLIDLDEGLDFGNPALGHSHPNLITFEVVERATQTSEVYLVDLVSGTQIFIHKQPEAGLLGVPSFTGDDRAIIYTSRDNTNPTRGSLFSQPIDPDSLALNGSPQIWLSDAIFGTVYRRGTFTTQNSLPSIAITSPTNGANFTAPAQFNFDVSASDSDGQIARVEFFLGSDKIAEDNLAPYGLQVQNAPPGTLRLFARAFDNHGASTDSQPIEVLIKDPNANPGPAPDLSVKTLNGGLFEIAITNATNGQSFVFESSPNLKTWKILTTLTHTGTPLKFVDPDSVSLTSQFYRVSRKP